LCVLFLLCVLFITIYFILLDELLMGLTQRRFGPVNLGFYGFLAAIINGCNLIITQYILPKHHFLLSFFDSPAHSFTAQYSSRSEPFGNKIFNFDSLRSYFSFGSFSGLSLFPLLFLMSSFFGSILIYPFFLIDISLSLIVILVNSGLIILFLIFSSFSGLSKYSMLGSIRLISQLISFELI
jgi:NADH:ubiquinone oxidoreductase subunit H